MLHDVGKPATFTLDETGCGHFYGHDELSAEMADDILRRLRASNELRHRVVNVIRRHMKPLTPNKRSLRRRLAKYGTEGVWDLLALQRADRTGTGTGDTAALDEAETLIREILEENACLSLKDLAVNGRDLMAPGFTGKAIGNCLNTLLAQVLEEQLPNDRDALLQAARERKEN